MKHWEVALAALGLALVLIGTWLIRRSAPRGQNILIVAAGCHTPATILEPPIPAGVTGTAIVLHGLGANRRTMLYLGGYLAESGMRAYLLDLPGHGDNVDAFTFAKAEQCADASVEWLTQAGQTDPQRTILVGHSMGGAISIRLADRDPVAATIAVSPGPLRLPRRMPANLLVFSGGLDLRPMKRQAGELSAAAGGQREEPQDFVEKRAFRLQLVPGATHTSLIVNSAVARDGALWALQSIAPGAGKSAAEAATRTRASANHKQSQRFTGAVMGLIGLALMFPAASLLAGKATRAEANELPSARPPHALLLAEQAVCALVAVLLLAANVPLRFLHLYAGDYLASLLLISGVLLLLLNHRYMRANFSLDAKALLAASALGLATILGVGAWSNWQLGDLWMNAPRWARFVALLPVGFVFCFAEEVVLGPVRPGRRGFWRFAVFLAMRTELFLALLLAYYELNSGQALLGVLVTGLAIFSMLQRLSTDLLRSRSGATAAAAFGAILAAWFIAAVFPLT